MSMDIMAKRYGEAKITPAEFTAKEIFYKEQYNAYKKKAKNFFGNEHTERFIKPLKWNYKEKVYGLVAPLCMPIYGENNKSFKEVKYNFLRKWKKQWCGELFKEYLWIVSEKVKKSKSKEIQSYIHWRDSKNTKNLAFIYLGYFWMYKDEEETLNEAAKRFFEKHQKDEIIQQAFKHECEKNCWEDDENKYVKAILNDGALLFDSSSKHAILKFECYSDPSACVWAALAVKGYFAWITQIDFISDYDEYLI